MKRMMIAALSTAFLFSLPALVSADESKTETKSDKDGTTVKTKSEHTSADGTKVKKQTKHESKVDGTGEAKSEKTVTDPATGAETKTTKKTKRSKNIDGSTETKSESSTTTK